MRSERAARFATALLLGATLIQLSAAPLAAQAADSLPQPLTHPSSHGMSWGRETFVLSEVLEYGPAVAERSVNYDLLAWTGGAVHRLWAKADGGIATRGRAAVHGEYQLLYGRLVSPFWDAQVGLRVDHRAESGSEASRVGAVVGLQGLAPGWFELEPSLFVAGDGFVSLDLTASYDLFVTQRLVLQPRLESSVALRDDAAFSIGSGLSSTSFGLRTRFEMRREFAPYVGVVWDRNYGRTARLAGGEAGEVRAVAGLRLWR